MLSKANSTLSNKFAENKIVLFDLHMNHKLNFYVSMISNIAHKKYRVLIEASKTMHKCVFNMASV